MTLADLELTVAALPALTRGIAVSGRALASVAEEYLAETLAYRSPRELAW